MALVGEWSAHRRCARRKRPRARRDSDDLPEISVLRGVHWGSRWNDHHDRNRECFQPFHGSDGKLGKAASVSDVTLTVSEIGGAAGLVLIYLVTFLAIGVVQRFYLQHELWRAVAQSLRLDNLDSAANVVAEGVPAGALGEGLADSLDVAGF
jgi:hypothetical protein